MIKATNIEWDIDEPEEGEEFEELNLPTEVEIPAEILAKAEENEDAISDYLSDLTGFCHKGFSLCEFPDNHAELMERVQRNCSLEDLYAICRECKHRDSGNDTSETISMESCFHICLNCPVFDCREAMEEAAAEAACS